MLAVAMTLTDAPVCDPTLCDHLATCLAAVVAAAAGDSGDSFTADLQVVSGGPRPVGLSMSRIWTVDVRQAHGKQDNKHECGDTQPTSTAMGLTRKIDSIDAVVCGPATAKRRTDANDVDYHETADFAYLEKLWQREVR